MRRELAIVVAAALTGLMMLLIAGHGPWAGEVIFKVAPTHGINSGDLPVIGLWLVGMAGVVLLARRD